MKDRQIIHADLDSFYASVECFYNPKIRNNPVVVGGDEGARHGIVLAKNQIAKKFNIQTGESLIAARQKCPGLVTVPANYNLYLKTSKIAKEIYREYSDLVEDFGIDESWIDCSNTAHLFGGVENIAKEISKRIFKELGITVSIGVSWNKIFSKLGSDYNKPNGITTITKENYKSVVWSLPAKDLLYVGSATSKKLMNLRIRTIGDLACANEKSLYSHLGKWGIMLQRFANGCDDSPVKETGYEAVIKSVGNSATLPMDVTSFREVEEVFYMLADSVAARLRSHKLKCQTVQISIRDKELSVCERQAGLEFPSYISSELAEKALEIFRKKYCLTKPIRSLGVRGTNLISEDVPMQLSLFENIEDRIKAENIEKTIDYIRERFGYHVTKRGILFENPKLTNKSIKEEHTIHPVSYLK